MKRILIFIFFIIPFLSYSQQKIVGFGKLKLGMDITEISELNPKNDTVEKIYNKAQEMNYVFKNNTRITPIELISDTNLAFDYSYIGCLDKRVREFHFGKFQINEDIFLTDITLLFFNNKLYTIHTSDDRMNKLLTDKYGAVMPTYTEKEVYFTDGIGNKVAKIEKHYKKKYKTNVPNYNCEWRMDINYLNNGDDVMYILTWLSDTKIENIVTKEQRAIENRSQKREVNKKRDKLNNF